MNTASNPIRHSTSAADDALAQASSMTPAIGALGQRAADGAERLITASKNATADAANSVQDRLDRLQDKVPSALSRAAEKADALTRAGIERAIEQGHAARERVQAAGDYTVRYVRDEPVKSLVIAAAVGALAALLFSSRGGRRD